MSLIFLQLSPILFTVRFLLIIFNGTKLWKENCLRHLFINQKTILTLKRNGIIILSVEKKNDVEIDEETQDEIAHIASNLPFDDEEYLPKVRQIPMPPSWAIRIKHYRGLKALLPYNLIEAKKAYPDEF